jgi:hypothetical protein
MWNAFATPFPTCLGAVPWDLFPGYLPRIDRSALPPAPGYCPRLSSHVCPAGPRRGALVLSCAAGTRSRKVIAVSKKLYVGNLAFGTTSSDLQDLFGQFGSVTSASVVTDRETGQSRGFAFVEMADGADEAIKATNMKDFQGRVLTVNEAKPREDRPKSGGYGGGGGSRGGYGGGGGGSRRY